MSWFVTRASNPWAAPTMRRVLGAAAGFLSCLLGCTPSSPDAPPNVVLVVLDTTRADHLSPYGYGIDTTPNLAEFARDAVLFEHAYATSTWTLASHASLFTGLLPATHRATQENLRLDEELDTLAELLSRKGYQTVAFTNNSWISAVTGLSQGFDEVMGMWRDRARPPADGFPHPTNEAIRDWVKARDPGKPLFLFVNYMEPHWPYKAPAPYRERILGSEPDPASVKAAGFPAITWYLKGRAAPPKALELRAALYDAELAYLDAVFADLLESLGQLGVLDDALVVVTSDHGENLGEHGHQGHSFALYESTLRIPLLIRAPGASELAGTRRRDPVQLTDVFTTIAAATGVETFDERIMGESLLGADLPDDRPIIAEYYVPKTFLGRFPPTEHAAQVTEPFKRRIRSIRIGSEKLIWGSDGRHELYDVVRDPHEAHDLIASRPERARALEAKLTDIVEDLQRPISIPQPPLSEMDQETIENLRSLGYLP